MPHKMLIISIKLSLAEIATTATIVTISARLHRGVLIGGTREYSWGVEGDLTWGGGGMHTQSTQDVDIISAALKMARPLYT